MLLQLQRGQIDLGSQDVSLDWQNIRFAGGLRSAFTTDITIPANHNNLNVLDASGLLDSPNQKFGDYLTPANLTMHDITFDVLVQVVSVNDKEIVLTLFEDIIPAEFFDKKIGNYFTDDASTIYPWSRNNTTNSLAADFKKYDYGFYHNAYYAQIHPSKNLNDIINAINAQSGYSLDTVDNDLYLIATKKTVCPQNTKQIIHCWCGESGTNPKAFKLAGGQHVVNDLEGVDVNTKLTESDVSKITFNRSCTMNGYLYFSMRAKAAGTIPIQRPVKLYVNNNEVAALYCSFNGQRCGLGAMALPQITLNAGDELTVVGTNVAANKFFQVVLDVDYSDYTINDDDYGEELLYAPTHPTIYFFPTTDIDDREPMYFDGRSWTKNLGGGVSYGWYLPYRTYSYFGYWCNVPDLSIKDLYYSLCWYLGKKVKMVNKTVKFVDANSSVDLRLANITAKQPTSDKLGKSSLIGYNNDQNPTNLTFDNIFIESEKWLHRSVFEYVGLSGYGMGEILQYEKDVDDEGNVSINFNEISNPVIMRYGVSPSNSNLNCLLPPHDLSDLDIGKLTTVMGVTIETYDEVKDLDYVYLDGRKYMVVDGEYEVQSHLSTLNCLLISTAVPTIGNTILIPAVIGVQYNDKKPAIGYRIVSNAELTAAVMRVYRFDLSDSTNVIVNRIVPTATSAQIDIGWSDGSIGIAIDNVIPTATNAKIEIDINDTVGETLVYESKLTKKEGTVELNNLQDGEYYVEIQALANTKYKKSTYYFNINNKEL